jgi:hypothetical protein
VLPTNSAAPTRPKSVISAVVWNNGKIQVALANPAYEYDDGTSAAFRFHISTSKRLLGWTVGTDDDLECLRKLLAPFTKDARISDNLNTRSIIARFFEERAK